MQTKDLKEIKKEFHQIMMDWIEKQWELEKAHQNGEPYTRMKFEAESAKIEDKMESLLDHAIQSAVEENRKEEIKFLERLDLECDVIVCDCGEEVKDWDIADLIKERLSELSKKEKGGD